MALWAALAITFSSFMLPTRIHERYLLPAVVLALLVGALVPTLRWVSAALSLTYLVNLYDVYAAAQMRSQPFGQYAGLVVTATSAANLALLLAVFAVGLALARGRPSKPDEPGSAEQVNPARAGVGAPSASDADDPRAADRLGAWRPEPKAADAYLSADADPLPGLSPGGD
jgi:hypothetical protein